MLRTRRLLLRPWRQSDLAAFAEHNANPKVMRYFPSVKSYEETIRSVELYQQSFSQHGFCFFAVDIAETSEFIGVIGLGIPTWETSFTPCIEVGWRLTPSAWGQGYATEGGRACVQFAFDRGYQEVLAFTLPENAPSRAVMTRLGMHHDPDSDFDHPLLPGDHPMRRHVVYRVAPKAFAKVAGGAPLYSITENS